MAHNMLELAVYFTGTSYDLEGQEGIGSSSSPEPETANGPWWGARL